MKGVLFIAFFLLSLKAIAQDKNVKFSFEAIDTTGTVEWNVFKFYVSNVTLHFEDGSNSYLSNSFYLVDMNEPEFTFIHLPIEHEQAITGLDFSIGTDSLTNVSGAFDGPLDPIHGMFWTWNSGYINLKMEGVSFISDQKREFEYHIGGYAGEHKTIRQVHLDYSESTSGEFKIQIDLNQLMHCVDIIGANQIMSPGTNAALFSTHFAKSFYAGQ